MTTAAAHEVPKATGDGMLERITVLILTYDEADNIERTLAALARFTDIIVLDSASSDATPQIAERHPHTRLTSRPFDGHAAQWNHGLERSGIERPWVLALDADYVLPAALVEEIAGLRPDDAQSGYEVSFRYCVHGRRLTASLYPPHG